jgi:UPF0271 protein
MPRIDLNCDLGEGAGQDTDLMPLITSANIACGAHAGDVDTMRETVELALKYKVAIGAHPSLSDRENFGRRELLVSPEEVRLLVLTQTRLLQIIARQCGAQVTHVKPHGALYNMAARDPVLAQAVARAVHETDPALILFGLAGSELITAGRACGLRVAGEIFADRAYRADGSLMPRNQPGAMIADSRVAIAQVLRLAGEEAVLPAGRIADTVCLHGDGPQAVFFARKLREALAAARIEVKAVNQ